MEQFIKFLTSIIGVIAEGAVWYLNGALNHPLLFWIVLGIVTLAAFGTRSLFIYGRSWIVSIINSDPYRADIYTLLELFRDARDYLTTAYDDLNYSEAYTRLVMVGKVPTTQYVPEEYPNASNAKACLVEALQLLHGQSVNLTALSQVAHNLPDIEELKVYQGQAVDEDTFTAEQVAIQDVIDVTYVRIRNLESQLPWQLVFLEKQMMFGETSAYVLLWIFALLGGTTAVLQLIFFGFNLLLRPSAPIGPR